MAQIHIMDESVKHYTEEVGKARKMKLDLILSERSIVFPIDFHPCILSGRGLQRLHQGQHRHDVGR